MAVPTKSTVDAPLSLDKPQLVRRFGLLPATALNMTNMMGVGPFITIPLLMSALGGPQAMLGWVVALVIVICDGMVWSELGAAMPGSGGSFHYLREAFGRERVGRLMAFLFVWQFVLSGPLEIASGYIGFASYASYIWTGLTRTGVIVLVTVVGIVNIALLYRRIHSIARITVSLWVGTLVTVLAVIVTGAMHFDARIAFAFPPGAFRFSLGFFLGLGAASRIGIYDYLGYYDVCYIGDEVRDPGRVVPRSILISTAAVALIYLGINLSIIGVVPWREFVPADAHPESSFIVSIFMQTLYGPRVATVFTLLVLWTAFGSVFALLLGYSRIPFAAAESGYFFRIFGRLHPTKGFPYVSLLVLGAISILAGFFSLGTVIDALIVTRILVQFMGQVVGLMLLRKRAPELPRPYRMWLYPVPAFVALAGWVFVFATTELRVIVFGVGVLALGCVVFLVWSRRTSRWPFAVVAPVLLLACGLVASCAPRQSEGERLARTYCAACHVFPEPSLLDKQSWLSGVLPQMAPRLGVSSGTLYDSRFRNPQMVVLEKAITSEQFQKIAAYYRDSAPERLPAQGLAAEPQLDSTHFRVGPFVPGLSSSGIVTLLEADTIGKRIYVGEAGSNTLRVFDWNRKLLSTVTLGSPPTSLLVDGTHVLVLESGILDPNDEPKGSLVQYELTGDSLRLSRVLIDSLYRPVFVRQGDLDGDGVNEIVICEFGNNRGRLALYKLQGNRYERRVLDGSPGAIRVEVRDLTGDGKLDIIALFAQGDERIVLFENDGHGNFTLSRILARFPPVYGSMYFAMRDFNGDGKLDIVYVNGDNFDYSRVLKPYHGIRILENDGHNNFHERYFFPLYGAAQAVVADFDGDGYPDILAASNFADLKTHPERGIMYLENLGGYHFRAYDFTAAAGNQWNVMTAADLNGDGRLDVLVGAMNLATIARVQQRFTKNAADSGRSALLLFENTMQRMPPSRAP